MIPASRNRPDDQASTAEARATIPRLLIISAGLFFLFTLFRITLSLPRGSGLTHESGVLSGLAMDFRDGLFYRPLFGAEGYGGTRYGPLHIVVQGILMRVGMDPIASGHLISLSAAFALVLGAYALLRKFNLASPLAACFAVLGLVGLSAQYAVTSIRLDLLATALNIWGLFFVASDREGPLASAKKRSGGYWRWLAGGSFFTLAILTKFTDIFAALAAVIFLLHKKRILPAIFLAAITGAFSIAAFAGFNGLSHGRMLENFRRCANSGRSALAIHRWFSTLYEVYIQDDWIGTLLMAAALFAWLGGSLERKLSLLGIFLIAAVGMTPLMFFSPGVAMNHLLDTEVAAALYLGFYVSEASSPRRWPMPVAALFLCSVVRFSQPRYLSECFYHRIDAFRTAALEADPAGGPIFSDNALVPVTVGQSPFLLDDFTFPAVRAIDPRAQQDLYHRLETGYFGAVILRYDPSSLDRPSVLGKDFVPLLRRHYRLIRRVNFWDHLWVYGRAAGE